MCARREVILEATYDGAPQPRVGQTFTEKVRLRSCLQSDPADQLQIRTFNFPNEGIEISTRFYWPPSPQGPIAGYTAPIVRWEETTINGLTSAPIVLDDEFAQTYTPTHHNFSEYFIFEPFLDPDVPTELLEELKAKNIRRILLSSFGNEHVIEFFPDESNGLQRFLLPLFENS